MKNTFFCTYKNINMKKTGLLLALLVFCICFAGYADNEPVKIVILLTEQADPTVLLRDAALYANQQERRQFVIETLKQQAETSQYDLLGLLNEMERNDLVSDIHPLWIVNAVSCHATPAAIHDLEQRRDILTIGLCEQTKWIFEDDAIPALRGNGREIAQNLLQVNAPQVWEQGYTGQGVLVAIIDTGINYDHADLVGLLFEFDADGKVVKDYFLGDQEAIAAKMNAVANQGKAQK